MIYVALLGAVTLRFCICVLRRDSGGITGWIKSGKCPLTAQLSNARPAMVSLLSTFFVRLEDQVRSAVDMMGISCQRPRPVAKWIPATRHLRLRANLHLPYC